MLYYLVPYIFITFLSLNIYFKKLKVTWQMLLFLLLPAILVAGLRGNVGTDSIFYLGLLEDYRLYGESRMSYEPGFEILNKVIAAAGATPRLGVAIIAVISTLVLCKAFSRSRNEMILFALVLFPLFYYDFTMNGLRYGLSFCLATLAVDALYKKKYWYFALWGILAFTMQYSSLLILLLFLSVLIPKKYIIIVVALLGLLFVASPGSFAFFLDRLSDKQDAYSEIYAPAFTSGLAPLLVVFFLYANFLYFHRGHKYSKLVHTVVICEVLSFVIAKFTYAGLRLQGVFMYCMILYIKNNTKPIQMPWRYIANYTILSLLAILLFFKNIQTVVEDDYTPFLPYNFFWEEKHPDRL